MRINEELCIGCGSCVPYCPMGCISLDDKARIDLDECVECGVCFRSKVCPVDAIYEGELDELRLFRKTFSDPWVVHPSTNVPGRGTEEMKTNEVTGRFKRGYTGIAIELGRPGTGTRFYDVEKIAKACAAFGVEFEPQNPVTAIMVDKKTGKIDERFMNEKTLSAIVEFTAPNDKVVDILKSIKEASKELSTVASLEVCCRREPDGSLPMEELAKKAGFTPSLNGKVNVGLGRPLAKEE